ncbi:hypothetical protein LCGC14_2338220, partial [marine sediment metagenome]
MTRSMTGFGGAQGQIGQSHYALEIRAVNGRYFKAHVKLPEIWSFMETDIEKYLRDRLRRGSIQLTLRMKSDSPEAAYEVNIAAMERYLEQVEIVRPDQSDVNLTVDLATILQLPGVCAPRAGDGMDEAACAEMVQLVSRATDALVEMRTTEGQAIARDLQGHCQTILSDLEHVRGRAGTVVAEYHQRLKARVAELVAVGNVKIDEQDLAREVAIFVERCDIA